jgi:hypothetical protein
MNEITAEVKQELETVTHEIVTVAQCIVIKTEQENTKAATLMAGWKAEKKRRVAIFKPSRDAAKTAYDEVRKLEAATIDPIEEAITLVNGKCGAFVKEENDRRAALQAKEDARVAELQRKEDERFSVAQAKAAETGKAATITAPRIIPQRTVAAVSAPAGTTYREYWSARVTDIKALCAAVVAGTADVSFVQGNETALNAWAKMKKTEGVILPGVTGVKTVGTTQRSA